MHSCAQPQFSRTEPGCACDDPAAVISGYLREEKNFGKHHQGLDVPAGAWLPCKLAYCWYAPQMAELVSIPSAFTRRPSSKRAEKPSLADPLLSQSAYDALYAQSVQDPTRFWSSYAKSNFYW
eukprot:IDg19896t1